MLLKIHIRNGRSCVYTPHYSSALRKLGKIGYLLTVTLAVTGGGENDRHQKLGYIISFNKHSGRNGPISKYIHKNMHIHEP